MGYLLTSGAFISLMFVFFAFSLFPLSDGGSVIAASLSWYLVSVRTIILGYVFVCIAVCSTCL